MTLKPLQSGGFTEERQRAEGRRQKGRKIFDLPDATGFKAPKFIYEKQRKYVFRDAQRKKYYVLVKSPDFSYGDSFCPLPSAFCLLKILNESGDR